MNLTKIISTTNENTDALLDTSKEDVLDVNAERTKYTYMVMNRHQND